MTEKASRAAKSGGGALLVAVLVVALCYFCVMSVNAKAATDQGETPAVSANIKAEPLVVGKSGPAALGEFALKAGQMQNISSKSLKVTSSSEHSHYYGKQLREDYEIQLYNELEKQLIAGNSSKATTTSVIVFDTPIILPEGVDKDDKEDINYHASKKLQRTLDAFRMDHPDFYWITGKSGVIDVTVRIYNDGSVAVHSASAYYAPDSQKSGDNAAINSAISSIVSEARKESGHYAVLKKAHDLIAEKITYSNISSLSYRDFQLTGAFADGAGVCEAYSRAFMIVAERLGYPAVLVVGKGSVSNNAVPHMWNYIQIEGSWYGVDVTWDDQSYTIHDFFLAGSGTAASHFGGQTFGASHIEERRFNDVYYDKFSYPSLSKTAYL